MGQSRPWSPTRRRLRTRDRRAKVRSISRWHLRLFVYFFALRLRQPERFNLLAMASRFETIAMLFSSLSLFLSFPLPLTYMKGRNNCDYSHNLKRNFLLFCAFKWIWRRMKENKRGGRVDARWFYGTCIKANLFYISARLWSYLLPNERLIERLRCAALRALFSVRCGAAASWSSRCSRFDYYQWTQRLGVWSVSSVMSRRALQHMKLWPHSRSKIIGALGAPWMVVCISIRHG